MKSILLCAILSSGAASAVTLTQTQNYTINESRTNVSGATEIIARGGLFATVQPFDASLGTLESITMTCTLEGTVSGILANPGGGVNVGYSGNFLINGIDTGRTGGGGNGSGGGGGMAISYSFTSPGNPLSFSFTFPVSGAGIDFDAGILTAVQGTDDFDISWDTALTVNGAFDSMQASGTGSVQLIYTYSAVPEPTTSLLALGALGLAGMRRRR